MAYLGIGSNLAGFNLFAYCGNNPTTGYDPEGHFDWDTFFSGAGLISTGLTAIAVAATIISCGAAAPLMVAVATVTAAAGAVTVVNGTAEVVEAGTGYNVVRDGAFGGDEQTYEAYRDTMSTIAEVGTAICGTYYAAKGGNVCFVEGTPVQCEQGAVPIETVTAGMLVWAWDEETGDVALKEVVETYVNETYELVHVFVDGEEIITTPSHPFYSPVKGWTDAVQLRAGDILVLVNGEYVVVEKVQHEILETPVTVYNFQVEDYHTYYVANGVLVHNSCGPNGTYQDAPYHRNGNAIKSPRPINGQAALDNSIQIKPTSPRRIGTSNNQIVVLDQTSPGLFHGHVRSWAELTETMKSTLIKAGLATPKGALK